MRWNLAIMLVLLAAASLLGSITVTGKARKIPAPAGRPEVDVYSCDGLTFSMSVAQVHRLGKQDAVVWAKGKIESIDGTSLLRNGKCLARAGDRLGQVVQLFGAPESDEVVCDNGRFTIVYPLAPNDPRHVNFSFSVSESPPGPPHGPIRRLKALGSARLENIEMLDYSLFASGAPAGSQ